MQRYLNYCVLILELGSLGIQGKVRGGVPGERQDERSCTRGEGECSRWSKSMCKVQGCGRVVQCVVPGASGRTENRGLGWWPWVLSLLRALGHGRAGATGVL